jgi:hypothetical protein
MTPLREISCFMFFLAFAGFSTGCKPKIDEPSTETTATNLGSQDCNAGYWYTKNTRISLVRQKWKVESERQRECRAGLLPEESKSVCSLRSAAWETDKIIQTWPAPTFNLCISRRIACMKKLADFVKNKNDIYGYTCDLSN